jgi:hypothetical protein
MQGGGSGMTPALQSQNMAITQSGLEAAGEAGADLTLAGPGMALQFMNPALRAELGISGMDLSAWQTQQQMDLAQQQMAQDWNMYGGNLGENQANRAQQQSQWEQEFQHMMDQWQWQQESGPY